MRLAKYLSGPLEIFPIASDQELTTHLNGFVLNKRGLVSVSPSLWVTMAAVVGYNLHT